jgi:hypothetical protein
MSKCYDFDAEAIPEMTGWVAGWGNGVTGPNTPNTTPSAGEACRYHEWEKEYEKNPSTPYPKIGHTVVSLGMDTICIIPGPEARRDAIAKRIVKCVNNYDEVLSALKLAQRIIAESKLPHGVIYSCDEIKLVLEEQAELA